MVAFTTSPSTWPSRTRLDAEQGKDDISGRILVLDEPCSWKGHLAELEPTPGHYLYVVYEDETNKSWRVQAVPVEADSFESRKPLPEEWCGLRDRNWMG